MGPKSCVPSAAHEGRDDKVERLVRWPVPAPTSGTPVAYESTVAGKSSSVINSRRGRVVWPRSTPADADESVPSTLIPMILDATAWVASATAAVRQRELGEGPEPLDGLSRPFLRLLVSRSPPPDLSRNGIPPDWLSRASSCPPGVSQWHWHAFLDRRRGRG